MALIGISLSIQYIGSDSEMDSKHRDKIRSAIVEMVNLERAQSPDWERIFLIGDETLRYICENDLADKLDSYVIKYLDDSDVRQKDVKFGEYQRTVVLEKFGLR